MTTFLIVAYVAAVTLLLTASLSTNVRLIRQRDAAVRRGNLALAGWKSDTRMHAAREAMLLDDLDNAVETAVDLRERVEQLEAEALPKAPNWGAAPAEWREQNATPSIFMLHAIENGVVA